MGEKDIERQAPNVQRIKMLGAKVIPATSGSKTLKDATNEAIRYWINNANDAYYLIGSVVGPHPYPDIVAKLQSIISKEIKIQLKKKEGKENPDYVFACIGGGSNATGAFYHFINKKETRLIGVEAGGLGTDTEYTAATLVKGSIGILHGSKSFVMQTKEGQVIEPHSISAGLDYPGIGPIHAFLKQTKKALYTHASDSEAIEAAKALSINEGIIPALESAHAISALSQFKFKPNEIIVVNLSGRGDKDMSTYIDLKNQKSL
jgi:tryptophan synthase beta chain